jgi:hypothetical protein
MMDHSNDVTLIERTYRRIQSDDCDQSDRLVRRYEGATPNERQAVDDVFICLCGYSLQTLDQRGDAIVTETPATRHNSGPTLRATSPRGVVRENSRHPRWQCPACGSANVQVRLPVWFTEYLDGELIEVSIDEEADPQAYYCADCFASEAGSPVLVEAAGTPAPIAEASDGVDLPTAPESVE